MTMFPTDPTAKPLPDTVDHEALLFERVAQAVAEGAKATVMVRRVQGALRPYLGQMPAADFSHDAIQAKYGGGRYSCQLNFGGKLDKSATFDVEGAPTPPAPLRQVASTPVETHQAAPPTTTTGNPMLDLMREELAHQRQLMMQLLMRESKPAGDATTAVLLEMVRANSGPSQFHKALELTMELQAMAGGGGKPESSGLEGMIERVASKILERVDRPSPRRVPNTAPALPQQPAAAPQPQPAPSPTATTAPQVPAPIGGNQAGSTPVEPAWPQELIDAEAAMGLPIRAMVRDLQAAIAAEIDADTAGIMLLRRVERTRALAPSDEQAFEDLDGHTTARQLAPLVPSLAGHEQFVADAIENMCSLALDTIDRLKTGAAT